MTFASDPDGDDNHNGISNFVEYAVGASFTIGIGPVDAAEFPTLSFTRNLLADDVTITVESSDDLVTWTGGPEAAIPASAVYHGDGTPPATWRSTRPHEPGRTLEFLRLRLESGSAP